MRGAHVGNNATPSPPGADGLETVKPTWQIEFPPGTTTGYRVLRTIELDAAPGYVAPAYFKATYDDRTFPCLLTLLVRLRRTEGPVVSIHLDPRLDQYNVDLWEEDGRTSQLEPSPYEHLGRARSISAAYPLCRRATVFGVSRRRPAACSERSSPTIVTTRCGRPSAHPDQGPVADRFGAAFAAAVDLL